MSPDPTVPEIEAKVRAAGDWQQDNPTLDRKAYLRDVPFLLERVKEEKSLLESEMDQHQITRESQKAWIERCDDLAFLLERVKELEAHTISDQDHGQVVGDINSLLDHWQARAVAAETRAAELEAALTEYAPERRDYGWHQEECWTDPDDWQYEQWLENAEDPGTTMKPWKERQVVFEAWKATQPEPTDEQLCDANCPYPRVRALLASVPSPPKEAE